MTNFLELQTAISHLGGRLAACNQRCKGIVCEAEGGRPPRCLFLETAERQEEVGTVVIGINPGRAKDEEVAYYRANKSTYATIEAFFRTRRSGQHPYYKRLRTFVDAIGRGGPILWTELVKCENPYGINDLPPPQTLRTCTARFLVRELELVEEWPIVAVGREAFKAAAYIVADRAVVGVPHPTGSHGHWFELFSTQGLRTELKSGATKAIENNHAIWLPELAR